MTLKELKKHYEILKTKDSIYHLHTKEVQKVGRYVHKYLASLEKKGKSFRVVGTNNKFSNTLKGIQKQINGKLESNKYDSDLYSPLFRYSHQLRSFIFRTLDNLGFESGSWSDGGELNLMVLKQQTMSLTEKLYFNHSEIEDDSKQITMTLGTNDSSYNWVRTKMDIVGDIETDLTNIKESIDGLLKPYFMLKTGSNLTLAEKMDGVSKEIEALSLKNNSGIPFMEKTKMELKGMLEEMLEKL